MSEIDTSTEAIAALASVHRGKIDGTVRGEFYGRTAEIIDAIAAERDALRAEVERLREALTIAANRLQRCAVDFDAGSHEFIETSEWATDARTALKGAANE